MMKSNNSKTSANTSEALKQDLHDRIATSKSRARSNYFVAYLIILFGVASSAAASISVAAGTLSPVANAVIAALPGICVMILNTFKFEARSRWWWKKSFSLIEIQAELEETISPVPEADSVSTIKIKMAKFLLEHSKEWPGFEFDRPPLGVPIKRSEA